MTRDFGLTKESNGLYSLTAPTTDIASRLENRLTTQMLSTQTESGTRGSFLASEVANNRVRTNSSLKALFSVASVGVLRNLKSRSYDVTPDRLILESASVESYTKVNLVISVAADDVTTISLTVGS